MAQSVYKVSEPTCRQLSGGAFVYSFRTYLQRTVRRKCSLILLVLNLHPEDSLLGCILFYSFQTLLHGTVSGGGGGVYRLFIKLRTYLQGTARVWCNLFIRFLDLPPGNCLPGWSLFIRFQSLPPGDYRQGVQLVLLVPNLHPVDCLLGICSLFYGFQTFL